LFWRRVEDYRLSFKFATNESTNLTETFSNSENQPLEGAKQIYLEFIDSVNLPDYCLSSLKEWHQHINSSDTKLLASNSNPHFLQLLYCDAQTEIWNLMKSDSLHRFMQTSEYKTTIQERWNADSFVRNMMGVSPSQDSRNISQNEPIISSGGSSVESSKILIVGEQKEEMDYVL